MNKPEWLQRIEKRQADYEDLISRGSIRVTNLDNTGLLLSALNKAYEALEEIKASIPDGGMFHHACIMEPENKQYDRYRGDLMHLFMVELPTRIDEALNFNPEDK